MPESLLIIQIIGRGERNLVDTRPLAALISKFDLLMMVGLRTKKQNTKSVDEATNARCAIRHRGLFFSPGAARRGVS
jgi:hypothetical protein